MPPPVDPGRSIRPTVTGLVAGTLYLAAGGAWLALAQPPGRPAAVAWFVLLAGAGALLPGLANQVSLGRAYLAAPGLAYAAAGPLPALVATVLLAGLTDLADGTVARHLERPSSLGGALDPVVDGLFFGAVALGLAAAGAYPGWLAAVIAARYALPGMTGALLLVAGRRPVLRHTPLGRLSTAVIALLLGGFALAGGLGLDARPLVLAAQLLIPMVAIATFANLAWANRAAIRGDAQAGGRA